MQFRWSGQIDGCHQDSEKDFHSSRREIRWPVKAPTETAPVVLPVSEKVVEEAALPVSEAVEAARSSSRRSLKQHPNQSWPQLQSLPRYPSP